jgi:hypothetical protein
MTGSELREQDIFTRVHQAIDLGNADEAIRAINATDLASDKVEALLELSSDLARTLAYAYALALALVHARALAGGLDRDRALAGGLDLVRALDLAHDLSRALVYDLARALIHDLAFERDRALALDRANDLAHALDRVQELVRTFEQERVQDLVLAYDRVAVIVKVIINILSTIGSHQPTATVAELESDLSRVASVMLEGIDQLTPTVLSNQLAPYRQAIIALERAGPQWSGGAPIQPKIRATSYNPPMSVDLEDAGNALIVLKEDIIPWRRAHAKEQAQLVEGRNRVAAYELVGRVMSTSPEAEKQRLENERLKWRIDQERAALAAQIIDKFRPNLEESEHIVFMMRLFNPLLTLTQSAIEIGTIKMPPEIG